MADELINRLKLCVVGDQLGQSSLFERVDCVRCRHHALVGRGPVAPMAWPMVSIAGCAAIFLVDEVKR